MYEDDLLSWKFNGWDADYLVGINLHQLHGYHFTYERLRAENADYLVAITFEQRAEVGEGESFPLKVVEKTETHILYRSDEPKYEFVFNGIWFSDRFRNLHITEVKKKTERIFELLQSGQFIKDFSEDNYKDGVVIVYLKRDSKYFEGIEYGEDFPDILPPLAKERNRSG
jgi:hypothetical protein